MPCETYGNVIICGPPRGVYRQTEMDCPECDARHGAVLQWDGAWYGTTTYGSCGDRWQDGYRAPRPFARYWRRDAQKHFQAMWDNAAPADLYEEYVRADCDMACSGDDDWEEAATRRDAAHDAIRAHQMKDN